jgi:hypothetical protein
MAAKRISKSCVAAPSGILLRRFRAAAEIELPKSVRQRKKFEDEAEFYKKRQLPADVAKGLRDSDQEIRAQESVIESKKKDLEAIRLKYDEDLRRFVELSKRPPARP